MWFYIVFLRSWKIIPSILAAFCVIRGCKANSIFKLMTGGNMSGSEKTTGENMSGVETWLEGICPGCQEWWEGICAGGFVRDSHRDTARQYCFFISLAGDSTKILPHNLCFESLLSVLLKMLKCSSRHIYVNMCRHVNLHKWVFDALIFKVNATFEG